VLRGEEGEKVFADGVQPASLASVGRSMGLIDVRKNDLTIYDTEDLNIIGSVPATTPPVTCCGLPRQAPTRSSATT
jgi:hypothetical protein